MPALTLARCRSLSFTEYPCQASVAQQVLRVLRVPKAYRGPRALLAPLADVPPNVREEEATAVSPLVGIVTAMDALQFKSTTIAMAVATLVTVSGVTTELGCDRSLLLLVSAPCDI